MELLGQTECVTEKKENKNEQKAKTLQYLRKSISIYKICICTISIIIIIYTHNNSVLFILENKSYTSSS